MFFPKKSSRACIGENLGKQAVASTLMEEENQKLESTTWEKKNKKMGTEREQQDNHKR